MKQATSRISVIVPLYNHENYIASALDSVYSQSVLPKEVIVVDDGSRDFSLSIVQKKSAALPDTMIFWSHPNQGAHYTINAGIHRATGEFVSILNSDDVYSPDRFAECLNFFDANPDIDAVCTELSFLNEYGKPIRNPWYEQAYSYYKHVNNLSLALINGNFFMTTSNLVVRRTVFDEIGWFSALRYAHDLDFLLRLILRGKKIGIIEKPLLSYRIHSENTISEGVLRVKVEWAAVVAFFVYGQWKRNRDWNYYAALTRITDQHTLTRLLIYFFAYYQSLPPDELSCDAFTRDENFLRFIYAEVK